MTALLTPLLALVEDAGRAPSSHNTQPWSFRVREDAVELRADRTRALPVNDPLDRELVLSCGAALANLCTSAAHHHLDAEVALRPDPDDPDHLATVRLTTGGDRTDARLAPGIRSRRTWRGPFSAQPLSEAVIRELLAAARGPGVQVSVVDEQVLPELVGLVVSGDRHQFEDPHWRRELASWMHPRRSGDGLAVAPLSGAVTRMVVTHVDLGERTARRDGELTASAPLVIVLGSDDDDEMSWLEVGEAMQRLLLTAAVHGVHAGFSNQPCQVRELRPRLASLVGQPFPHLVLRLGHPDGTAPPAPRRPVHELLDDPAPSETVDVRAPDGRRRAFRRAPGRSS